MQHTFLFASETEEERDHWISVIQTRRQAARTVRRAAESS